MKFARVHFGSHRLSDVELQDDEELSFATLPRTPRETEEKDRKLLFHESHESRAASGSGDPTDGGEQAGDLGAARNRNASPIRAAARRPNAAGALFARSTDIARAAACQARASQAYSSSS